MNYRSINQNLGKVAHFDRGGVFFGETANGASIDVEGFKAAVNMIGEIFSKPIEAVVVYSQINQAAELDAKVKNETTFKRSG